MKNIVIDTCVFIHIVRDTITGKKCLERLEKYDEAANVIVSVVTKAELESFITQNSWEKPKITKLNKILEEITYIDISSADQLLIDSYTEIDAFSKKKIKDKSGVNYSSNQPFNHSTQHLNNSTTQQLNTKKGLQKTVSPFFTNKAKITFHNPL